jgi:hypothetical protein
MRRHPNARSPIVILTIALLGISVAAPLIRVSHDPPLAIAVWRLGFSLLVIIPFLGHYARLAPVGQSDPR